MELFKQVNRDAWQAGVPLAERVRPKRWEDFFGQGDVAGEKGVLRELVEGGELTSMILWGPPGSGKTTLGLMLAGLLKWKFVSISAVMAGVKELREAMQEAEALRSMSGQRTILFVDEIHRFNKAQQDALLPFVERGSVVLIGATTENPSFEVNSALLSRLRVYVLQPLEVEAMIEILDRAQTEDAELKRRGFKLDEPLLRHIAEQAAGDARKALNIVEYLASASKIRQKIESGTFALDELRLAIQQAVTYHSLAYDKAGQQHYDAISALHKSMRNSDPDAALYWLARMLEGGEDPLYVARRIVRFASEDIGLADNRALTVALQAKETAHFVGMPECELALAQAVVFMALAPKNNSIYVSYGKVKQSLKQGDIYPVPYQLRNAVTKFDSSVGFGKGYEYAHSYDEGVTAMNCLPTELSEKLANGGRGSYYVPKNIGSEAALVEGWKERLKKLKKESKGEN